ncbi:MAG: beta galactosidase jelly roll domain-containing protein [Calditrichia bacterium]
MKPVNNTKRHLIFSLMLMVGVLCTTFSNAIAADEYFRLVDLRGQWKFEIGDDMNWAKADFDDSGWEEIFVPASWEDEGFHGYDGFAWYRKSFELNLTKLPDAIFLELGHVDDSDEVYLNGKLVGAKGSVPPHFITAYNIYRQYLLPFEYLNPKGENVIAIRVYDERLNGGIVSGKIGLYGEDYPFFEKINLEGVWKLRIGDEEEWQNTNYDDSGWETVMVPLNWNYQGFRDYDGYAWYRKNVQIPAEFGKQKLVLLLGQIDDLDETYFNGKLIGRTGERLGRRKPDVRGNEWQIYRAYEIPNELINYDGNNLIAVRVYDDIYDGGIYNGPVAIVTEDAIDRWDKIDDSQPFRSFWEVLDAIFK